MFNPTIRRSGARPAVAARLAIAAGALASPAALSDLAAGQCQYEVTAIIEGPPSQFCGTHPLIATAINDSGHVTGYWNECVNNIDHPFIWTPEEGMVTLDPPVGEYLQFRPTDINSHGDICGWIDIVDDDVSFIGFVLTAEGGFITIPVPEGGLWLEAHAINDKGQVCGFWYGIPEEAPGGAFIWENGKLATIPPPEGYVSIRAFDINEAGQLTGKVSTGLLVSKRAMLWDGDVLHILPPIPEGTTSEGSGIGSAGQVVGYGSTRSGISHAYTATEKFVADLGGPPGFEQSWASMILDNDLIVGNSSGPFQGPTIWHNAIPLNLTNRIADPEGLLLGAARAINASGQILIGANSQPGVVAAVLTPAPGPDGDISGDCKVDIVDLVKVLDHWSATDSFADIDGDGSVGVADLLLLLGDWTG